MELDHHRRLEAYVPLTSIPKFTCVDDVGFVALWFYCKQLTPSPHCNSGMVGYVFFHFLFLIRFLSLPHNHLFVTELIYFYLFVLYYFWFLRLFGARSHTKLRLRIRHDTNMDTISANWIRMNTCDPLPIIRSRHITLTDVFGFWTRVLCFSTLGQS